MSLPNLIVIGAMKSGTTSLHHYLRGHPDIYMSVPKELNYFVKEHHWDRGLDWYKSHFAGKEDFKIRGETTPAYSAAPIYDGVPRRIADLIPDASLIYIVRDPIARIRSQWRHEVAAGRERLPIGQAVLKDPAYLARSRYASQIDRYAEHFDLSQLKVITNQSLSDRREETMARLFEFLGVDPDVSLDLHKERHQATEKRSRLPAFRKIRNIRGYDWIAGKMPRWVKQLNYRLTTRAVDPGDVELPAQVEEHLRAELAEEVSKLRNHMNGEFDGWGIA